MPTYDYECSSCGYLFEKFHSMLAEPLSVCPQCGLPRLVKLIGGGSAVIVRGTSTPCTGGPARKKKKQEKTKSEKETPFWRNGPRNPKVLDNPERYIMTGEL